MIESEPEDYLLAFFSRLACFFSLAVIVGSFFFSLRASLDFMVGGCWLNDTVKIGQRVVD